MPGTRERVPGIEQRGQLAVDDVPVDLRVAVFGAALAAELTRVVPGLRRVRGVADAVFGAAVFGAAVLEVADLAAPAFGAAVLAAESLAARASGASAFGAAAFGAAFAGASATASTTLPGVSDDERTFDQARSPRSARLP